MHFCINKVHSNEEARNGLVVCTTFSAQDQVLFPHDVSDCYFTVSDMTVESPEENSRWTKPCLIHSNVCKGMVDKQQP